MALPPFEAGAVNVIVAWAFPALAEGEVGAPGTVAGVTLLEDADAAPVPRALVAVTVNVYAVPFTRPVTTTGLAEPVPVMPDGVEVAV